MLVDVLTSAASWSQEPLLTYIVPPELAGEIAPGQLVAVPYGEHLVEGITWRLHDEMPADEELRPIATLLDPLPALLPHQRDLAEWLAAYYVTPLAHAALMMLPPGLLQRSKMVLQLIDTDAALELVAQTGDEGRFTRLRALIGLLLAERDAGYRAAERDVGAKEGPRGA